MCLNNHKPEIHVRFHDQFALGGRLGERLSYLAGKFPPGMRRQTLFAYSLLRRWVRCLYHLLGISRSTSAPGKYWAYAWRKFFSAKFPPKDLIYENLIFKKSFFSSDLLSSSSSY
jgi:hypothetical protein